MGLGVPAFPVVTLLRCVLFGLTIYSRFNANAAVLMDEAYMIWGSSSYI